MRQIQQTRRSMALEQGLRPSSLMFYDKGINFVVGFRCSLADLQKVLNYIVKARLSNRHEASEWRWATTSSFEVRKYDTTRHTFCKIEHIKEGFPKERHSPVFGEKSISMSSSATFHYIFVDGWMLPLMKRRIGIVLSKSRQMRVISIFAISPQPALAEPAPDEKTKLH